MPNIIIGGNTYQNINYVRFNTPDGTLATFVEKASSDISAHSPTAALVSATLGTTGITATVGSVIIEDIPTPTGELKLTV